MVALLDILLPVVGVLLAVLLVDALRRRVLFRMAFRNVRRHPRQSVMVVAGLMVGTAIVSGALVASDSMNLSIRKASFDSFGEIDETVFLEGYSFFPEYVSDELSSDPGLLSVAEGVAPQAIWDGSATNPVSGLHEANVRLIGFDPARDGPFGPFLRDGEPFFGEDLGARDAILLDTFAEALEAEVGDRIEINFSRPLDPLLPWFRPVAGNVTTAGSGLPPPVGSQNVQPYMETFEVDPNAAQVTLSIDWDTSAGQDLDVELRDPSGRAWTNRDGTTGAPDAPANVTTVSEGAAALEPGTWELFVDAKAAIETPFAGAVVVLYSEYNLTAIQDRIREYENATGLDLDPQAFLDVERDSVELTVRHITDGGKGVQFLLPTTLFLRLDALQEILGREGEINFVRVTNPGGPTQGPASADVVFPALQTGLNRTKAEHLHVASVQALVAQNDKVYWLAIADEAGDLFGLFLSFIGSFSVIAGLLLILNIFAMLAEERRSELGIGRAVGLRRLDLVRLFSYEGAIYAVIAAALGACLGLLLAWGLITGFNAFFTEETFPPIPFHLESASLLLAFSIGLVLALGTILAAAVRASRLNIVRAIRRLEEPEILRGAKIRGVAIVITVVGALGTVYAFFVNSFAWQVIGPAALAVGAALGLRLRYRRRYVYPIASLALLAYLTGTLFLIREYDRETGNVFGPLRAILMAIALVVLVLYSERTTRLLARVLGAFRSLRPVALPSTAYPLHKKFRTGLTLVIFGVVLLMVSLFSILGNLFTTDPSREMGAYHVRGESTQAVEALEPYAASGASLEEVAFYDELPFFYKLGGDLVTVEGETTGQFGPPRDTIWGIDEEFAGRNGFRLQYRHPDYPTDEAAYRAVAERDDVVIVSYSYSTDERGEDFAHEVGDTLELHARQSAHELTIVGIQEQFHFKGIFVTKDLVGRLFTNPDTMFLFAIDDPARAEEVAKALEGDFRSVGLDARDLRAEVIAEQQQFRQILSMIQLFLGLGLVIGVLSLGIVTARNVTERRQEIGMMRALGFTRAHIRRTFLIEMLAVVILGVVIGAAIAILVSFGLYTAILYEFDIEYTIPWIELGAIAAVAVATTVLATISPILRAARIPPAEALRYVE